METRQPNEKQHIVVGLLAHVDAGKTTLAEAMLYCSGNLRRLGRVDRQTAYLDYYPLERERGITIFSKQAVLELPDRVVTLLDTPGHADFAAEPERALAVVDCAVLVLSASEGVQAHTRTLWNLLRKRNIPTLVFWNKTDLPHEGTGALLENLRSQLGEGFFDALQPDWEEVATCSLTLMEEYVETQILGENSLRCAVAAGILFPCWFGSALHLDGIESFLQGLETYAPRPEFGTDFGARVYQISREERAGRLTHLKLTGGTLTPRTILTIGDQSEKITALYRCQGGKVQQLDRAVPGDLVAVSGLKHTAVGMGLGCERDQMPPSLQPVISYRVLLPSEQDPHQAAMQLDQLAEEDPTLQPMWDESRQELSLRLMGPIQKEILCRMLRDRFGLEVTFGEGQILYRETIRTTVEGVGHYEPLGHYAEVHLLLEPGEPNSGVQLAADCPEDRLDRNWQRLILTHLGEREHRGVLTGAPLTDVRITLVAGKAHVEHTEGGDFRQASYRAVRQGLMQADSVLLEPWYEFHIEVPGERAGRILTELRRHNARPDEPVYEGTAARISGRGPVRILEDYARTLAADTGGTGRLTCTFWGYAPCPDQQQIVEQIGYDPRGDLEHTPDSIFCSHGAGHQVPWDQVFASMHVPSQLNREPEPVVEERARRYLAHVATDKELLKIFERTYGPIKDKTRALQKVRKPAASEKPTRRSPSPDREEFLLVDGYNMIFAWPELKKLAEGNLDDARVRLIDRMRNYQGYRQYPVILVFDAYQVKGNPGSVQQLGGLSVVYTKEAETADAYIEKTVHKLGRSNRVRVATSDALEQIIILGGGAMRISAPAFEQEVLQAEEAIRRMLTQNGS